MTLHLDLVTSGAGTADPSGAPEFTPGFSGVPVTQSLVLCLCVCFVDRLSFFFWLLCYLFFDIQILITSLWYLQTLLASVITLSFECKIIKHPEII